MIRKISEMFDGSEGGLPLETPPFDAEEICALTLRKIQPRRRSVKLRRRVRSLLLVAAIVCLLGASAYALGISIHRQRQEEIRSELQIDEHHVEDYVEYPVPEEPAEMPTEGATLLSAINDGQFQQIWVLLSGVTPEQIEGIVSCEQTDRDGSALGPEDHRYRWIDWTMDGEHFGDTDTVAGHSIREGYDEESRTLTLRAWVLLDELPEDGSSVELHFWLYDCIDYGGRGYSDAELVCDLGSVRVGRTGQTLRTFWFAEPIPFENEETGGRGEFLGVEIHATGLNWLLRHDDMEQMYCSHDFSSEEERQAYLELERSWIRAIDELERGATLNFADGSSRGWLLPLSSQRSDGVVKDMCSFGDATIDPDQAVSVTIGGVTVPLE